MKDLYLCSRFTPDEEEGYPENSRINIVMRSIMTVKKTSIYYEGLTVGERSLTALLKGEEIVKLRRKEL